MARAVATNPHGECPSGEQPEKAIDGNINTKWLDFNKGKLMVEFPSAVHADQFSFTTANDEPGRDPVSWRREGSQDADSWTTLHVQTNFATPTLRKTQTKWFFFVQVSKVRPTVGDTVKILWEGQQNCLGRAGQIGEVIQDDGSSRPFEIYFPDVLQRFRTCWATEAQVSLQVATMCETGIKPKRTSVDLAKFVGDAYDNITRDLPYPDSVTILTRANLEKAILSGKFDSFANGGKTEDMDKREVAAFLANVFQETGQMTETVESGCYGLQKKDFCKTDYQKVFWCCDVVDCKGSLCDKEGMNCQPKCCDTCRNASNETYYYGRGGLQLSYPSNYASFLNYWIGNSYTAYKVDKDEAQKVATNGTYAWASALWFWTTPGWKKPSCSQVMQCDSSIDTSSPKGVKFGFGWTINLINGAKECNQISEKAANRAKYFKESQFNFYLVPLAEDLTSCEHMEPY